MRSLTAIDAFCGAGGLSIGLADVGFNVLLGFDFDKQCVETLKNNPNTIRHAVIQSDVKDMLGGKLLECANIKKGELDLLAGGPPCQGFSVQRTIGGDRDARNLLVDDYGDLIAEVAPRFFLMENVPGIGGKRGREIVDRFKDRMTNIGYFCHEKILDAQDYGVPQRRRRFIVVGEKITKFGPFFNWPKPTRVHAGNTVRNIIGHLPPPPADGTDHPKFFGHRSDRLSDVNKARLQALKEGQARDDLPEHLLADCHKISSDVIGHRNVYGRMAWDEVAPTITARFDSFTRGKFGHPEQTRSISLLEGALLQTFPESYRFSGTKVEIARQIGNAVPPKFAAAIGGAIVEAIGEYLRAVK
jgi:DNA (cytosine-5)-methyltransferase 1